MLGRLADLAGLKQAYLLVAGLLAVLMLVVLATSWIAGDASRKD